MHRAGFVLAATMLVFPQAVSAADIALSCVLTDEDIVFVPQAPSGALSVQRHITEKADLAIRQSVLLTPAGAPCDRIAGSITSTNIDVSCSFPPQGIGRAAIAIQIDLRQGTITETWATIEHDGSQSHFYKHGTCTVGDAPLVAEGPAPAIEPSLRIAVQQTALPVVSRTGSKPPSLQ